MENNPPGIPAEAGFLEEVTNLRHYYHVILERRWLVIAAFISVFVLTIIYLAKAPRIYQAAARLQINSESETSLNLSGSFAGGAQGQDYLQTQYKNLMSRSLLSSIINQLKLDQDPRYAKSRDIVMELSEDITVSPIRLSRLVDVRVEHTDPKKAALIANTLLNNFIDNNLDQKREASVRTARWLEQETAVQKTKVEEADNALQKYRVGLKNVSLEESQNIILQRLKLAQDQMVAIQVRATLANGLLTEVQSLLKKGVSIDNIPAIAANSTVTQLKNQLLLEQAVLASMLSRYKDKWPDVITEREKISALQRSLEESMRDVMKTLETSALLGNTELQTIRDLVATLEQEQLSLGEKSIKYDALKRDAELQKGLYMRVLERQKELEITTNSKLNNMFIVDEAVAPLRFYKPRIVFSLVLGIIGGLVVAVALAFFVNYLDDSIKTQDDVEIYLRVPFLGYVPNIKSNSVIERDLQAHMHPQSTAAEGFRTIRAAIALMPKADQYRLLVITSTIPAEGKSLIASNLAIVTAQTGLKTLLVDADLRRPSVHKAYQLHSPIGLSAYLTSQVNSIDEIVHTSEVPHLDIVCAGSVPSNPSEMSGSLRMRQFLQEASRRYDRVFVDCPPVSAVSDPLVVSSMADGVIFVTKFNKIRREHARKSLQRLQYAGIHILGVVLNDIDFEGKDAYYYSYYYYQNRYYSSHYKSDTRESPKPEAPQPEKVAKA